MTTDHVAYSQGEQDARDGYGRNSCPYQHEPFRTKWHCGFDRQRGGDTYKLSVGGVVVVYVHTRSRHGLREYVADLGATVEHAPVHTPCDFDLTTGYGAAAIVQQIRNRLGGGSNIQATMRALPVHVLPNTLQDGTAADDSGCTHVVVSELLDTQNCNHKVALCFDEGIAKQIARLWNENLD